jgi:hypothetical protein
MGGENNTPAKKHLRPLANLNKENTRAAGPTTPPPHRPAIPSQHQPAPPRCSQREACTYVVYGKGRPSPSGSPCAVPRSLPVGSFSLLSSTSCSPCSSSSSFSSSPVWAAVAAVPNVNVNPGKLDAWWKQGTQTRRGVVLGDNEEVLEGRAHGDCPHHFEKCGQSVFRVRCTFCSLCLLPKPSPRKLKQDLAHDGAFFKIRWGAVGGKEEKGSFGRRRFKLLRSNIKGKGVQHVRRSEEPKHKRPSNTQPMQPHAPA